MLKKDNNFIIFFSSFYVFEDINIFIFLFTNTLSVALYLYRRGATGGGVWGGYPLLLWKIWSQLSPILGENLLRSFSDFERRSPLKSLRFWEKTPSNFLQFWKKISLKFSPIFRENTLQNLFLTLSPIFKNTPPPPAFTYSRRLCIYI
jgi:hypothetical protein